MAQGRERHRLLVRTFKQGRLDRCDGGRTRDNDMRMGRRFDKQRLREEKSMQSTGGGG